jgi:hypothetical protein
VIANAAKKKPLTNLDIVDTFREAAEEENLIIPDMKSIQTRPNEIPAVDFWFTGGEFRDNSFDGWSGKNVRYMKEYNQFQVALQDESSGLGCLLNMVILIENQNEQWQINMINWLEKTDDGTNKVTTTLFDSIYKYPFYIKRENKKLLTWLGAGNARHDDLLFRKAMEYDLWKTESQQQSCGSIEHNDEAAEDNEPSCPICANKIKFVLSCGHAYCGECSYRHSKERKCPYCRQCISSKRQRIFLL